MRTTLFIIASIFVLNAFPKIATAQDNSKECEELKKEITSLQDLLANETATLRELTNQLEEQRKLHQKALDAFNNWAKNYSHISGFEEFRTKFLDDLAIGAEIIRALKNAIDETDSKIQKLKNSISDLLNKLADCGKPKKTAMKEKTSSNNLLAGNTGNFELCGGVGYGFSFNGGLLGQNRTFTATDRTFDGVYGSWAQGENFFIKTDFKVSNCFNVGAEFDYTYGKNIIWDQNTIGATSTTNLHYEGRYTGYSATPFIQFNPCGSNHFNPYVDLGLRLNFSNSIKQNVNQTQTSNNNTTTTIQEGTLKGMFSTGFDASLGAKWRLNNRLSFNTEVYSSNSNLVPDKFTITKYMINGTDQLGTLTTSQKQTNYLKNYTVPTSTTDPNSPSKALRSSLPISTVGIRFGIDYKF